MTRIPPVALASADPEARPLLENLQTRPGHVLNYYATLACAPAALRGVVDLKRALSGGRLTAVEREQIAVLVAQLNECQYCLSAHVGALRRLGLTEEAIVAARRLAVGEPRADALLRLAATLLLHRGAVTVDAIEQARGAGLSDADLLEVVAHVALNVFSNYANLLAQTKLDLPEVTLELPSKAPAEAPSR